MSQRTGGSSAASGGQTAPQPIIVYLYPDAARAGGANIATIEAWQRQTGNQVLPAWRAAREYITAVVRYPIQAAMPRTNR